MAPYIRKARHRRFKRFRYSLKFLTWLERQALRVGMPARTLYNDYLVSRLLSFEQVEALPNGLPGGGSGPDYSRALVYFDANTPFTGTASDVTAITSRGSAGLSLAKTGAAAIRRTADGFVFADTGYVSATGIPAGAATDGMFVVVEFTQTAIGSNGARLSDGTGSRMRLQVSSTNQAVTGTGADDTSVNIALGTATLGTRYIVAVEMDDVLDRLTGYDVSGALVGPIAHTGLTDPVNTRIDIGQFVNGTIHRWCIVGRPEGGAWPLTMAEVFADFQAA